MSDEDIFTSHRCDGTLTDGKIHIGTSGEAMKVFNVKDGYAIVHL